MTTRIIFTGRDFFVFRTQDRVVLARHACASAILRTWRGLVSIGASVDVARECGEHHDGAIEVTAAGKPIMAAPCTLSEIEAAVRAEHIAGGPIARQAEGLANKYGGHVGRPLGDSR